MEIHSDRCKGQIDAGFEPSVGARLQRAPPDDWPELVEIKSSRVRTVLSGTIATEDGQRLALHVKLFRPVTLSDRARDALRGSRAAREFSNLQAARARGLPAVLPIAWDWT